MSSDSVDVVADRRMEPPRPTSLPLESQGSRHHAVAVPIIPLSNLFAARQIGNNGARQSDRARAIGSSLLSVSYLFD